MDRYRLPHMAWLLVGDGEKALVFENQGDQQIPDLRVIRVLEQDNPPSREQGTDRPGRLNDGPSAHRSAVADTDWHQIEKQRFAKDVAGSLYKSAQRNRFEALVVIAPPTTLGELRSNWHKEVSDRIIGEIDKTLTNHPIEDIEAFFTNQKR